MWRRSVAVFVYKASGAVRAVAGSLMLVLSAALVASPERWNRWVPALSEVFTFLADAGWLIIMVLVMVSGAASVARLLTGPPWLWDIIQDLLDVFRGHVFKDHPNDDVHHHRVTLFKRVTCSWSTNVRELYGGWLVAVARSGFTTRSSVTKFRAPDQADQATGVAGMTWARANTVIVFDLPDLNDSPSNDDFARFAEAARVSLDFLKQRRPRSRSLAGFPIEVAGKQWGVVIVDSRRPRGIDEAAFRTHHRMLARFLGNLLEKAGR